MSLLKRIKNFWKLTELDPKKVNSAVLESMKVSEEPKMAQIIKMSDPKDRFKND